jgi:hypothetical protein
MQALREISGETALDEALINLRATIEESGAVVTHDALPSIMSDDTQMALVFQNLIGNAIKYRGTEPPQVHVSATKNGMAMNGLLCSRQWSWESSRGISRESSFFFRGCMDGMSSRARELDWLFAKNGREVGRENMGRVATWKRFDLLFLPAWRWW